MGRVHRDSGVRHLRLDPAGRRISFATPGLALDLGAIGKGYALDRAAEVLRESGVESALLHAGTSTVLALEPPRGREAWGVALRHPATGGSVATVELVREALSVSAPHGRVAGEGEERRGHVLDPRTGNPSSAAQLAAVVHPDAVAADAWSTARLVDVAAGLEGPPTLVVGPEGEAKTHDDAGGRFHFEGSQR